MGHRRVCSTGPNQSVVYFGAVRITDGRFLFCCEADKFNAVSFLLGFFENFGELVFAADGVDPRNMHRALPFLYPTTCETDYFGGIAIIICT